MLNLGAPMRALVTGVTGFTGRALALHLIAQGWDVFGSHSGMRTVPRVLDRPDLRLLRHNLIDLEDTLALVEKSSPNIVFHMAGQTSNSADALLSSHITATTNLLLTARRLQREMIILIPGSSAQFGIVAKEQQPIFENVGYQPITSYGAVKTAEACEAAYFHGEFGLQIIRTHTFNIIGPGQRSQFVPATFARQIAAMERGDAECVLRVGNLDSGRDMTDVRDVAAAYFHVATRGSPGSVYNICSGRQHTIRSVVEQLRCISSVDFNIHVEEARVQRHDVPAQIGDPSRLKNETGWEPLVPFEQTLADVLEEWRATV